MWGDKMTRILKLTYFEAVTVFGDKMPEYQKTTSLYSVNSLTYVSVTSFLYNDGREKVLFEGLFNDVHFGCIGWDRLEKFAQRFDFVLGDWSDNEVVALTPKGEQEVALLSSVPYLFRENAISGE
jgi:hypothetical protein